jgi:hypothetical protein
MVKMGSCACLSVASETGTGSGSETLERGSGSGAIFKEPHHQTFFLQSVEKKDFFLNL